MTEQKSMNNWNEKYMAEQKEKADFEKLPTFKVLDGENKIIEFLDNGEEKQLPSFSDEEAKEPVLIFSVLEVATNQKKTYFLNKKIYSILDVLSKNYPLIGKKFQITRTGSKPGKGTKYECKKI